MFIRSTCNNAASTDKMLSITDMLKNVLANMCIFATEYLLCGNQKQNALRNEFNFWNVHGIMNTSGLLQSK